ncbi:MAG TPA: hypothetical protein VNH11_09830 [Pirellulales bacterium]|nr:hypothetical protein [Pirellulales bacterium]
MSDSFECPKCKAAYTREKRQVGKAVICACGHKFLVPPASIEAAVSAIPRRPSVERPPAPATQPGTRRLRPAQPTSRTRRPSDSSGEVIPIPTRGVREPARPATPWADPVEADEAEPVMEAEVVHPGAPLATPLDADELFAAGGPYAEAEVAPAAYQAAEVRGRPRRLQPVAASKKGESKSGLLYVVFLVLLPGTVVLVALGIVAYRWLGSHPSAAGNGAGSSPNAASTVEAAPNEPAPSGLQVTLWDAKQRAGGAFSIECRVDGGRLNPSGAYFWIINGPSGRVEFPIPGATWAKQRQQLSGKAQAADGTELNGPLTCFIEEQVGSTRQKISNEVPVGR